MPRKTLKQKLKSQIRKVNKLREHEFQHAGITINFEQQAMQAVAMAHGVMATLLLCKQNMNLESVEYQIIEEQSQNRIAQCVVQLVGMGISAEEANQRIIQGH